MDLFINHKASLRELGDTGSAGPNPCSRSTWLPAA